MSNFNYKFSKEIFISISILLTSFAQIMLKYGMIDFQLLVANDLSSISNIYPYVSIILWIGCGLLFYAISMVAWMLALREYQLSIAYPLLSISYILVYVFAIFLPGIGEQFSFIKILGLFFIIYGIIIISREVDDSH